MDRRKQNRHSSFQRVTTLGGGHLHVPPAYVPNQGTHPPGLTMNVKVANTSRHRFGLEF